MNRRVWGIGIFIFTVGFYTLGFSIVSGQSQELAPKASGASAPPIPLRPESEKGSAGSVRSNRPSASPNRSPVASRTSASSLQELLKVYRAKAVKQALTEVKRLQSKKEATDEVVLYLLSELYLKQAEEGEKEAIPQAMASLKKAVSLYPNSEHTPFGHFRMGQIYARQKLFYEAIASFNRVIHSPSENSFQLKAQVETARVYQAWGKWERAKEGYEKILRDRSLPDEEKTQIRLGYADILYQMGQFEEAYQQYKRVASVVPSHRFKDPVALFQFGEAAYRANHFSQAKGLFLGFYNIYPKEPFAPVALVRFGTLLKLERKGSKSASPLVTPNLSSIDETINRLASTLNQKTSQEHSNLSRILLSIRALQECVKKPRPVRVMRLGGVSQKSEEAVPFEADDSIPCNMPLIDEAFSRDPKWSDPFRQEIRTYALNLLATPLSSTTSQGVILEGIYQLKAYKEIASVVEIEAALLLNIPSASPYRQEIQEDLNETIVKQLGAIQNPMIVVTLFHAYPSAFTKKMLAGDIGFVIAMSHVKVGLYSRAADLLLPVTKNFEHPSSDEALYQLGKVFFQLGEYEKAQRALELYQRRSPPDTLALTDLGDVYFKQGQIEKAILSYEHGLSHYPKHLNRSDLYLKLSEAHRYRNDFDNEIKVYLKWIQDAKEDGRPYARLADAYFQSGQYQKAIESYQEIINRLGGSLPGQKWKKNAEWAQLRLAMSYESLGQYDEGRRLFKRIAKKAKDPLIRKMAEDRVRSF